MNKSYTAEDTDSSVEGYDAVNGKWISANRMKRNTRKNTLRRQNKSSGESNIEVKEMNANNEGEVNGKDNMKLDSATSSYICKGRNKNGVCNKMVTITKQRGLKCEICRRWFHPVCAGMSADGHQAVVDHNLMWMCTDCRDSIPKFRQVIADKHSPNNENKLLNELNNKVDMLHEEVKKVAASDGLEEKINQKIISIEKSVNELAMQQAKVECSIGEHRDSVRAMPKLSEEIRHSADEIKNLVQTKDKVDREYNIIIHNVPECDSQDIAERRKYDIDSFYNIATSLLRDATDVEVMDTTRLGKTTGESEGQKSKPRLILAKLRRRDHVDMLIGKRTKLKDVGFPNIYLTKDLSPEDRAIQRSLRQELLKKGRHSQDISWPNRATSLNRQRDII